MELMNQVLFGIFTLILFGVYLTSASGVGNSQGVSTISPFWRYSIALRALAFLSWVLTPIFGQIMLPIANFSYDASVILLALFIRSWRVTPGKNLLRLMAAYFVCTCFIYMYFYFTVDNFIPRITIIGISTLIMMFWEVSELWKFLRSKKGALLSVVFFFVFIQLIVAIGSLAYVQSSNAPKVQNILQADVRSSIVLWIVFGIHTLIYILINSYLYQNLWISERNANQKYDKASQEREEIRSLLSERERLIASLLKSNKTAATGALAASLAHELNQPLGASLINAQSLKLLLDQNTSKPELERSIINSIESDTRRAGQIIHSLRSLFSGDAVTFDRIDLTELVSSIIQLVEPECRANKIDLIVNMPDHCFVQANSIEIHQVVLNLLNNAIHALSQLETSNQNKISIVAQERAGEVILVVTDNGLGVAVEKQSSLFDLLDTQKTSGMGLGLWLCKHIMNRHQGDIVYSDAEGSGAAFTLKFPPHNLLIIPRA